MVGFEFTSATVAEGNTQRVCLQIQSGIALNSLYVQIFTVPHTATGKLKNLTSIIIYNFHIIFNTTCYVYMCSLVQIF